ncbi:MAG: beta-propeller fold lactonase family protein [Telmatospirillum sp.]|nr:beta-propeller fold lactonase family protein [Telmatospirillum sp.]
MLGALCLSVSAFGFTTGASAKTFVYVSNAEDGDIDGFVMNKANGVLTSLGKTKAGKLVMPMAVSPNKQFLYAAVRSQPFTVVTYAIDPASGVLTQKATAPLPDSMAYLSTDKTGRFLFSASYGGNKIAVNPINASGLVESEAIQVIPTGENAHCIRPDRSNKFVYATNLGSSQILQFRFDAKTGALTPNEPPLIKSRPDNGPRHIVFSPDGKYLYVIHELSGNIAQFSIDKAKGTLTEIGYTGSVPPDSGLLPGLAREAMPATATSGANTKPADGDEKPRIWAADLQITPNGKFLYASERTGSKIALLSIAPATGKPTYVTNYPTETQPRGIRIDPTGKYLVASGEKSDRVSVYKINQADGRLTPVGRYPVGKDANWVEIVDLP